MTAISWAYPLGAKLTHSSNGPMLEHGSLSTTQKRGHSGGSCVGVPSSGCDRQLTLYGDDVNAGDQMRVLVAGSTGFVGQKLCPALTEAGHEVLAMTRRPEDYGGAGEPVTGDVADPASLVGALQGCEAAYYLVHRLGEKDFTRADAEAAKAFGPCRRRSRDQPDHLPGWVGQHGRRPLGTSAKSSRGGELSSARAAFR